jgi:hypothetical protein
MNPFPFPLVLIDNSSIQPEPAQKIRSRQPPDPTWPHPRCPRREPVRRAAGAAAAVTMTSPAPTSWFSGLSRSSSTMAGGVASASASASASGPASAFLPDAPKSVIGAGSGGGKRNHLCGALFKYGPKSAQVRAGRLPPPRVAPLFPRKVLESEMARWN